MNSCGQNTRLSAIVNFANDDATIAQWLKNPSKYYIEAFVRFDDELSRNVIFGIDQEWLEGVKDFRHAKGGDWMGLIGLQRNGKIWVAVGNEETHKGIASKDRKFEFYEVGQELKPNIWYRLYSEVDYSKRRFISFTIDGGGINKTINLSNHRLDYPNMLPFDKSAMTHLVFALSSQAIGTKPIEMTSVYFDEISGGIVENQNKIKVFTDGFEDSKDIFPDQPWNYMDLLKTKSIRTEDFIDGVWYIERAESFGLVKNAEFAKEGNRIAVLDAVPTNISKETWFKSQTQNK